MAPKSKSPIHLTNVLEHAREAALRATKSSYPTPERDIPPAFAEKLRRQLGRHSLRITWHKRPKETYMKDVVHSAPLGQAQPVRHLSNALQNLKRTIVATCQLCRQWLSHRMLAIWLQLQKYLITYRADSLTSNSLCCIISSATEGGVAAEGGGANTKLGGSRPYNALKGDIPNPAEKIQLVRPWEKIRPLRGALSSKRPQILFQTAISHLCLAMRLRMIGRREVQLCLAEPHDFFPNLI